MNDTAITEAVRATLHRHSLDAPDSANLLERVKARRRGRTILRRVGAGASALAVAAVAALVTGQVLQPASQGPPTGPDETRICFDLDGNGIPQRLLVTEFQDGEIINDETAEWTGGSSSEVEHPVNPQRFWVSVKGWDELDLVPIQDDPKDIEVNGRDGRIGNDDSGDRMLAFETGERAAGVEVVMSFKVIEGDPSDEELVKWAEKTTFHTDTEPCEDEDGE